jgi:hypothetical protein
MKATSLRPKHVGRNAKITGSKGGVTTGVVRSCAPGGPVTNAAGQKTRELPYCVGPARVYATDKIDFQ